MNSIGQLEWHIAVGDELPKLGDILSVESKYNGQTYKVKVVKIKRLEWGKIDNKTHLVVYLMVRSVGE